MNLYRNFFFVLFLSALSSMAFVSCKDNFTLDENEPGFLGSNIYDNLSENGDFKYFVRLIDELDYKEVLKRTGSKTIFPANDEAFERFFKKNPYGVTSFEELTPAQKRSLMNASMVNNAYLTDMLSSVAGADGPGLGQAFRRETAFTYLDTVAFVKDETLFANDYWKRFSNKGLYLLDDEYSVPMVHFTPTHMAYKGITDDDFKVLFNGMSRNPDDIFVNGIKILTPNQICKNGYIHVLEDVLTPLKNMSQIIRDNGKTNQFNKMLNRFSAPYYDATLSKNVHDFYDGSTPSKPLIAAGDSVFVKRYFTTTLNYDPNYKNMTDYGLLYFDPSLNTYSNAGTQTDMGVMFVPTDKALNEYINGNSGKYLRDAYGSWDNIPSPLLAMFLKNHQKKSFINSLPNYWGMMTDESSFDMNISTSDVDSTIIGCNGAVYITNKVYPPVDYQCVYASTLLSNDTKVMNWAIQNKTMKFYLYLRSMENMYNLLVPTDEALQNYKDPISWCKGENFRQIWKFWYSAPTSEVYATVYDVTASGERGDSLKIVRDQNIIRNRLADILDTHIIVGNKTDGVMSGYMDDGSSDFVMSKSGTTLKVSGTGDDLKISGGGDLENSAAPAHIVTNPSTKEKCRYDSENGRTFFINKVLQDPFKSVYEVLGEHPKFAAFYNLLKGNEKVFEQFANDDEVKGIFDYNIVKGTSSGMGYVVNSFNNYRYTVFVPTKEALDQAFIDDPNLYTWDEIAEEQDKDVMKVKTLYLLKFLRYHFMDNVVYVSKPFSDLSFETAARNPSDKFYKLTINGADGNNLTIKSLKTTAKVDVESGLYNIMARDYIVDNADYTKANNIISSSRSVIHLINNVLRFQ